MLGSGFGPGLDPAMACPVCEGPLAAWGGYRRQVRLSGVVVAFRLARVVCRWCGVTHVLLPGFLLARRLDVASSVVSALRGAAGGRGHRPLAAALLVPGATVRGWLRRLRWLAAARAAVFWRVAGELGLGAARPPPGLSALGGLWRAVSFAHHGACRVFGDEAVGSVGAFASRVTSGGLLFTTDRP